LQYKEDNKQELKGQEINDSVMGKKHLEMITQRKDFVYSLLLYLQRWWFDFCLYIFLYDVNTFIVV
jgi:hypothetical protein